MGGSVKVHSEVDKGTNFKVTLRTSMLVENEIYRKLNDKELNPIDQDSLKKIKDEFSDVSS